MHVRGYHNFGMAYRRYKKRVFKKKVPSRWQTYGAAGTQLVKDVMMLKGLVNAEEKTLDNATSVSIGTTAAITNLTLIGQGADRFNRNGNSIKAKSLYVSGLAYMNGSATSSVARIVYFIDHQADGTAPTQAELFATTSLNSPLNIDNAGRFKVLYDKMCLFSTDRPDCHIKQYIPLHHHIKYAGSTAAEANSRMGQIYRFVLSDQVSTTVNYQVAERFRFIDN